jgi:hypothetical protein
MKDWYTENINNTDIFEPAPDIEIWRLEKQKYNKKKNIEKFFIDSVRVIRKIKPISEKYSDAYKYELGIYIILDYKPDWILFMYPSQERNRKGKFLPYVFAHHYSVPYNKDSTKKQIQFHKTEYLPHQNEENLNGERGSIKHDADHFKNNIKLYLESYEDSILNNKFSGSERKAILDMLKFYRTHQISSESEMSIDGGGGTTRPTLSKPNKKSLKISRAKTTEADKPQNISLERERDKDLEKAWRKYKLDHVWICAIKNKNTNKYGVTVTFYDHQIRHDNETHDGFFFIMNTLDANFVKDTVLNYIKNNNLSSSGLTNEQVMLTDDE